jgi:glutaredoxin
VGRTAIRSLVIWVVAAGLVLGLSGAAYRLASASASSEGTAAIAAIQAASYTAQDPDVAARVEGATTGPAAAATDVRTAVDPDPAAARAEVPVVVYTTTWCPVCKRAKAWMTRNGIRFEERDVEASRENARRMRELNPRGSVPTIVVGGDFMVGFSEADMLAMLDRAGRRRSARGM